MGVLRRMGISALPGLLLLPSICLADPYRERQEQEEEGSFANAVNPNQFRKGNPEWDTQELVSSGMKALHEEHRQILREIRELRARLSHLEEEEK